MFQNTHARTPTQRDQSMLTFEGQQFMGTANISQKMAVSESEGARERTRLAMHPQA